MSAWWLENNNQAPSQRRRTAIAAVLSGASATGTVCFATLSFLSGNSIIAGLQAAVTYLLFPGVIVAIAVSGNAHGFSLWVAALINAAVYFGLGWFGYGLLVRHESKT
jgi:hypothetical protein